MTVCDQAVRLPLPQHDPTEEQLHIDTVLDAPNDPSLSLSPNPSTSSSSTQPTPSQCPLEPDPAGLLEDSLRYTHGASNVDTAAAASALLRTDGKDGWAGLERSKLSNGGPTPEKEEENNNVRAENMQSEEQMRVEDSDLGFVALRLPPPPLPPPPMETTNAYVTGAAECDNGEEIPGRVQQTEVENSEYVVNVDDDTCSVPLDEVIISHSTEGGGNKHHNTALPDISSKTSPSSNEFPDILRDSTGVGTHEETESHATGASVYEEELAEEVQSICHCVSERRGDYDDPQVEAKSREESRAAEFQSRDAEVQTVTDGTLNPSHLSEPVESACQTGDRMETTAEDSDFCLFHYDDDSDIDVEDVIIIKPPAMFCDSDRDTGSVSPVNVGDFDDDIADVSGEISADIEQLLRVEVDVEGSAPLISGEERDEDGTEAYRAVKTKMVNSSPVIVRDFREDITDVSIDSGAPLIFREERDEDGTETRKALKTKMVNSSPVKAGDFDDDIANAEVEGGIPLIFVEERGDDGTDAFKAGETNMVNSSPVKVGDFDDDIADVSGEVTANVEQLQCVEVDVENCPPLIFCQERDDNGTETCKAGKMVNSSPVKVGDFDDDIADAEVEGGTPLIFAEEKDDDGTEACKAGKMVNSSPVKVGDFDDDIADVEVEGGTPLIFAEEKYDDGTEACKAGKMVNSSPVKVGDLDDDIADVSREVTANVEQLQCVEVDVENCPPLIFCQERDDNGTETCKAGKMVNSSPVKVGDFDDDNADVSGEATANNEQLQCFVVDIESCPPFVFGVRRDEGSMEACKAGEKKMVNSSPVKVGDFDDDIADVDAEGVTPLIFVEERDDDGTEACKAGKIVKSSPVEVGYFDDDIADVSREVTGNIEQLQCVEVDIESCPLFIFGEERDEGSTETCKAGETKMVNSSPVTVGDFDDDITDVDAEEGGTPLIFVEERYDDGTEACKAGKMINLSPVKVGDFDDDISDVEVDGGTPLVFMQERDDDDTKAYKLGETKMVNTSPLKDDDLAVDNTEVSSNFEELQFVEMNVEGGEPLIFGEERDEDGTEACKAGETKMVNLGIATSPEADSDTNQVMTIAQSEKLLPSSEENSLQGADIVSSHQPLNDLQEAKSVLESDNQPKQDNVTGMGIQHDLTCNEQEQHLSECCNTEALCVVQDEVHRHSQTPSTEIKEDCSIANKDRRSSTNNEEGLTDKDNQLHGNDQTKKRQKDNDALSRDEAHWNQNEQDRETEQAETNYSGNKDIMDNAEKNDIEDKAAENTRNSAEEKKSAKENTTEVPTANHTEEERQSPTTEEKKAVKEEKRTEGEPTRQKKGEGRRENFSFLPDEVPEMQVMVNSLTPVLQRRKVSARRSNSHSGATTSNSGDTSPSSEDLQNLLASFAAEVEAENRKKERSRSAIEHNSRQHQPQQDHGQSPSGHSQLSPGLVAGNHIPANCGESSLFMKPKFAKTWHGQNLRGNGTASVRPAPRMGVAVMTSDTSSLTLGHSSPRDGGGSGTGGKGAGMGGGQSASFKNTHTMPMISRTLLDALHKRYYSYQYSSTSSSSISSPLGPGRGPALNPILAFHQPSASTAPGAGGASLTLNLPPELVSAPLKKLNSEGESDTGSSAATSSAQSSPRTAYTQQQQQQQQQQQESERQRDDGRQLPMLSPRPPSTPDCSPAKLHKRNEKEKEQELEAVEACQWLRAAGFPQYAQMFEDNLFPVDIADVQRDHDFLDEDSIQSVIRRLNILNTCAVMKIDAQPCKKAIEESEEEELCALSDRWEYQKTVRRWSRKGPDLTLASDSTLEPSSSHDSLLGEESRSHTDESPVLDTKMPHATAYKDQLVPPDPIHLNNNSSDVHHHHHQHQGSEPSQPVGGEGVIQQPGSQTSNNNSPISPKLRRAASERLKSALKKMESFKKKSKKYPVNRNIVEISGPVVADQEGMQAKLQHLHCVDISPASVSGGGGGGSGGITPKRPSPLPIGESIPVDQDSPQQEGGIVSPDSSHSSLSPMSPLPLASPIVDVRSAERSNTDSNSLMDTSLTEYYSAHSQLLASLQACSGNEGEKSSVGGSVGTIGGRKNSDSSLVEIFLLPQDHKPGSFPRLLKNGYIDTAAPFQSASLPSPQEPPACSPLAHAGSVTGHHSVGIGAKVAGSRVSVYDNCPSATGSPQHNAATAGLRKHSNALAELPNGDKSQVVRSLSITSSISAARSPSLSSSELAGMGMVRSQSASAATSLERQALMGYAAGNSGSIHSAFMEGSVATTPRKSSVVLDQFDAILQLLYQDINNLSRAMGEEDGEEDEDEEEGHNHDLAVKNSGSRPSREVSFSIAEQNGDISNYTESKSGLVKLQTQLSQTSTSDTDSFRLAGPHVDDSMDGEEGELGSQTMSDSSDEVEGSVDDTLERIAMGTRERRDSGVGSSLTRASSERKRKKIRWESFQKSHRPSRENRELQIGGLSVCQLLRLSQLSLIRLTSIMETCSPSNRSQWLWSVLRFMKRNKAPQFSDKNVFGVPFTVMMQRTGQPLPQCVLYAMRYLRRTSHDAVGIFRKSGVRSRIQKLRDLVESNPDSINFDQLQPYDVADLLKQYFRELPECLLTSKLSDTFRSIFTHVPQQQRLEALQTAVILLPEENREVLHCLLLFLGDIAQHADEHQMNASNLAVCFAPSLFNFMGTHSTNSPRRQRKSPGQPEHRELMEQKAVHECFTYMITECKKLFMVPHSMYSCLHLSTLSNMEPVHLDEFYARNKQPGPDYKTFGEEHIQVLLKEAHDKNRGWTPTSASIPGIEVLQRKPQDGHPLPQWKCSVEIEAPPIEVLNRILHERHKWDDDMLSWDVVERLDKHSDVFHYVLNSMAPHPPRHFMVLRYWRPDLVKGACALVSKSVEHSGSHMASAEYDQGMRAVELGNSYLIEPCGSGKSRLTYIARTDLRGRSPKWYNHIYGHMCTNLLDRLRDSFRQDAEGPETKV